MKSIFSISIIFITLLINACLLEQQESNNSSRKVDASDLEKIEQLGMRTDMVEDLGEYYLVEKDVMVFKDSLDPLQSKLFKQWRAEDRAYARLSHGINVYIHNSVRMSGEDNWRPEILQAMGDFNSISQSGLYFNETNNSSNANVIVLSDEYLENPLPENTIAAANLPTIDGNVGPYVFINLDFNYNVNVSSSQKRYNMAHEFGHVLGLRHTNWQQLPNEDQNNASLISGTNHTDAQSVFNGGTANYSWNGFSGGDLQAIRVLFPELKSIEPEFYMFMNQDLINAFGVGQTDEAVTHYWDYGVNEGRISSPAFDVHYYLSVNPDVAQAFGANNYAAAESHWRNYGLSSNEGRKSSPAFHVKYYLNNNSDIESAYGTNYEGALYHWFRYGIDEGRQASPEFDPDYYINHSSNSDVKNWCQSTSYSLNYCGVLHWMKYGRSEGRIAHN